MLWQGCRKKSDRKKRHRLCFESLEGRCLFALAVFEINLFEDVNGTPGAPVADDAIESGDTFFIEIAVRELHPLAAGLGGVAVNIDWDPDVFQAIDAPFDPANIVTANLPAFQRGTLDNDTGRIGNLSGAAILSSNLGRPIGNLRFERFTLLHFRALGEAEDSEFLMTQGVSRIVTVPVATLPNSQIDFERQTITVTASSPPTDADTSSVMDDDGTEGSAIASQANVSIVPTQIDGLTEASGSQDSVQVTTATIVDEHTFDSLIVEPVVLDEEQQGKVLIGAGSTTGDAVQPEAEVVTPGEVPDSDSGDLAAIETDVNVVWHQEPLTDGDIEQVLDESTPAVSHVAVPPEALAQLTVYGPVQEPVRYLVIDLFRGEIRPLSSQSQAAIDAAFADEASGANDETNFDVNVARLDDRVQRTDHPVRPELPPRKDETDSNLGIGSRLDRLEELIGVLAEEVGRIGAACRIAA